MRADRLLSIMLLLQIHRRMTSRELAGRLEVSERTIHRDMEALSSAGFPVLSERGAGGGWLLVEGYRTNLTGLSEAEVQALFLTRPLRLLADLGLAKASEAGLIKLQASLPLPRRRDVEFARQRIHVDVTGWHSASEAVPLLPALLESIWQDRKIRFTYDRGEDCTVERVADPLGLVAKGSVWYLVAMIDDDIRSYRVSRIKETVMMNELSDRPDKFDLAAHWRQAAVSFKEKFLRYLVTMRLHPDILMRVNYLGRFTRVVKIEAADADGWSVVKMDFQVENNACECLPGFGNKVEILDPPELRDKVLERAKEVIALYSC